MLFTYILKLFSAILLTFSWIKIEYVFFYVEWIVFSVDLFHDQDQDRTTAANKSTGTSHRSFIWIHAHTGIYTSEQQSAKFLFIYLNDFNLW